MNTKTGMFSCSFCGRPDHECEALVVGPYSNNFGVNLCICDECAELAHFQANEIITKRKAVLEQRYVDVMIEKTDQQFETAGLSLK
jgi:hypothetical protein